MERRGGGLRTRRIVFNEAEPTTRRLLGGSAPRELDAASALARASGATGEGPRRGGRAVADAAIIVTIVGAIPDRDRPSADENWNRRAQVLKLAFAIFGAHAPVVASPR